MNREPVDNSGNVCEKFAQTLTQGRLAVDLTCVRYTTLLHYYIGID